MVSLVPIMDQEESALIWGRIILIHSEIAYYGLESYPGEDFGYFHRPLVSASYLLQNNELENISFFGFHNFSLTNPRSDPTIKERSVRVG